METKRGHSDNWIVPGRRMLRTYEGTSNDRESVAAEFTLAENPHSRRSLPKLWHLKGHTDRELESWWSVQVYATDEKGRCVGKYNPTVKPGGCGEVRDFDWIMEATDENMELISSEIERRAFGFARRGMRGE